MLSLMILDWLISEAKRSYQIKTEESIENHFWDKLDFCLNFIDIKSPDKIWLSRH